MESNHITVRFIGEVISNSHINPAKLEYIDENGNLQYVLNVDKFIKHILENAEDYKKDYGI